MSYVHCHACNWQQDDFWTRPWLRLSRRPRLWLGYNPLGILFSRNWGGLTLANLRHAWRMLRMKYRTRTAAKKAGWECPKCGSRLCED